MRASAALLVTPSVAHGYRRCSRHRGFHVIDVMLYVTNPEIPPSLLLRRQQQRQRLRYQTDPPRLPHHPLCVCWSGQPGKRAAFSSRVFNILPAYCPL
ncbi:hypothetical protein AOLI_G00061310 [Acnodon oligacanthus]